MRFFSFSAQTLFLSAIPYRPLGVECEALSASHAFRLWRKAVQGDEESARELTRAILLAPWGANGSLFATRFCGWPHTTDEHVSVFVNRRLLATVRPHYSQGGEYAEIRLLTEEESRERETRRRERNRRRDAQYQRARARCIADLQRAGVSTPRNTGGWKYSHGCDGGTFYCPSTEERVSAPGVIRAIEWNSIEEMEWDRALYGARF